MADCQLDYQLAVLIDNIKHQGDKIGFGIAFGYFTIGGV